VRSKRHAPGDQPAGERDAGPGRRDLAPDGQRPRRGRRPGSQRRALPRRAAGRRRRHSDAGVSGGGGAVSGGRWVEVRDERQGLRPPSWLSPGIVVAAAFLLLIVVIIIGIVITRSSGERVRDDLTIAQLRADPEGYDGVTVELTGVV